MPEITARHRDAVETSASEDDLDVTVNIPHRPAPSRRDGIGTLGVVRRVRSRRRRNSVYRDMPPLVHRHPNGDESDSDDDETDGAPVSVRGHSVDRDRSGVVRPVWDINTSSSGTTPSRASPVSVSALDNFAWVTPQKLPSNATARKGRSTEVRGE